MNSPTCVHIYVRHVSDTDLCSTRARYGFTVSNPSIWDTIRAGHYTSLIRHRTQISSWSRIFFGFGTHRPVKRKQISPNLSPPNTCGPLSADQSLKILGSSIVRLDFACRLFLHHDKRLLLLSLLRV